VWSPFFLCAAHLPRRRGRCWQPPLLSLEVGPGGGGGLRGVDGQGSSCCWPPGVAQLRRSPPLAGVVASVGAAACKRPPNSGRANGVAWRRARQRRRAIAVLRVRGGAPGAAALRERCGGNEATAANCPSSRGVRAADAVSSRRAARTKRDRRVRGGTVPSDASGREGARWPSSRPGRASKNAPASDGSGGQHSGRRRRR